MASSSSSPLKETLFLRAFGFLKIPLLFFISPTVVALDEARCIVRVPLNLRTRNHLGSMYFGVLCAGADCAGGLIAMKLVQSVKGKVSLVFKDFKAEFLKRPEGDVLFTNTQGAAIADLFRRAMESGERENMPVEVIATCPSKSGDEPVAKFVLTLSLKRKGA